MMDKHPVIEWSSKRYLLVDDFGGVLRLLRDMLNHYGVARIDTAENGSQAIALLEKNQYDVVLCDHNLGRGKNGQQILEEAKHRDLIGLTCIWLIVSAEKTMESVMGSAELAPDGYILKPITEKLLIARLNRAWEKKQVFIDIDKAYAIKNYARAIQLCDRQLAGDTIHTMDLLRMKANLLLKIGELDQARAVFEHALAERDQVWSKTGLAKLHIHAGDYRAAANLLYDVLEDNPSYIDAYDQLALALEQMGELNEAEQVLEKVARLSPNSVARQRKLGEISLKLGNVDLAEAAFSKCVAIGEHSIFKTPDPYLGLAQVYKTKRLPTKALQMLNTVQAAFDSDAVRLRAKVAESQIYSSNGQTFKARQAAEEVRQMLAETDEKPVGETCLEVAQLMIAIGDMDTTAELLADIVANNAGDERLLKEAQEMYEQVGLGTEGAEFIEATLQETREMEELTEIAEWERTVKETLPPNVCALFDRAQVLIQYMRDHGRTLALAEETRAIIRKTEQLVPGQKRSAQLMKMLEEL